MTKPATVAKGAAPTGGKSKQANAKGKSKATATAHVKATATSTAQEPVPTADHLPLQESEAPHAAPTQQPLLLHALHFAQSLLHGGAKSTASTGGKHSSATLSLSTGDLLARLRTLHNELRQIGQENIDVGSLGMVTRELVASSLLHHKDNGVRSLVACCVVDLLRLYAPDAPYGEDELKNIFDLIIGQLAHIGDTTGAYFPNHLYLLESLSTVKSIVLMVDLPNADGYLRRIFTDFFENIRDDHLRNVKVQMLDILQQLVEESASVPIDCVEIVLHRLQRKQKTSRPAAYELAAELVKASKDRLHHYVSQYFHETIVSGEGQMTSEKEAIDAHAVILELYNICDGVLLSVIPQLELELKIEQLTLRKLATEVLGEMFARRGSTLAKQYPNVWASWLLKRNDKSSEVRLIWLDKLALLLHNHASDLSLSKEAYELLCERVYDPEESVRYAVFQIVDGWVAAKETNLIRMMSPSFVDRLVSRTRDKKLSTRMTAVETAARLYNFVYADLFTSKDLFLKFSRIPTDLLEATNIGDKATLLTVEHAVAELIFAPNPYPEQRCHRLLAVISTMSKKAYAVFTGILMRNQFTAILFGMALAEMTPKKKTDDVAIARMCGEYPEPLKARGFFRLLFENMDQRTLVNFKKLMERTLPYKDTLKMKREITKRFEKLVNADEQVVLEAFMQRLASTVVHSEMVPVLLKVVAGDLDVILGVDDRLKETAVQLLKDIAKTIPKLNTENALAVEENYIKGVDRKKGNAALADVCLYMINKSAKSAPQESLVVSSDLNDALSSTVMTGSERHAKWAMTALALAVGVEDPELYLLQDRLSESLRATFNSAHIVACTALLMNRPAILREVELDEVIAARVLQALIAKQNVGAAKAGEKKKSDGETLVPMTKLSDAMRAKLSGIRFLARRVMVVHKLKDQSDSAKAFVQETIKLLMSIIEHEGQLPEGEIMSGPERTHLRLQATLSLLKMATVRTIDVLFSESDYLTLALSVQDAVFENREMVVGKMIKYMHAMRLHARFMALMVLAADEPEEDLKERVFTFLSKKAEWLRSNPSASNVASATFFRLMHVLAHHSDITNDSEGAQVAANFLNFFLDVFATVDNVSYIYHVAGRLKTVEDVLGSSVNLYMLSDLAQHLIRDRCATHSWPLPSYPLAVDMPSALFRKIRDEKLCKRIFTKNFLPAGFVRQKTAAVEPAKQTVRVKKTLSADDVEDDFGSDHDEVMPVSKKRTAAVKSGKAAEETMEDESDDMDSELAPVKKGAMGKRVRRG